MVEEESQSLLMDEDDTEDDSLVEDVLATLAPLADRKLVQEAVNRKDIILGLYKLEFMLKSAIILHIIKTKLRAPLKMEKVNLILT